MEKILNILTPIAEGRFIKDGSASLSVYTILDNSYLVIDLKNMATPELAVEEILEFYRDIYNKCNIGSSNDIIIRNNVDSGLIIKIPLIKQGRNNNFRKQ